MEKFFSNKIVVVFLVSLTGFFCGVLGVLVKHKMNSLNSVSKSEAVEVLFYDNSRILEKPQILHEEEERVFSQLVPQEEAVQSLPRVIVRTVSREQLFQEAAEKRRLEEEQNFLGEYPEREKSNAQKRNPVRVTADNVFKWLTTPGFFEPTALKNVEKRVVDAKEHLNALFESGKYRRLLSPQEIVAIICRETCDDDKKGMINLTCLGDRSMKGYEKAHGPLQISQRAYRSVDAVKGFGLIGPDFHGDLALSELVFQAWVFEHCQGQNFEWISRCWNAGPTGALKYKRAYGYFHGDNRKGVKQYLEQVVQNLPSVKGYDEKGGDKLLTTLGIQNPDQDGLVFFGPAGAKEAETLESQYSKAGGAKFELPSWDEGETSLESIGGLAVLWPGQAVPQHHTPESTSYVATR